MIRNPPVSSMNGITAVDVQAFAERQFCLSYHLLAAALYAAEGFDSMLLIPTSDLAARCQKTIDEMKPQHRLSSNAARFRGNHAQHTALTSIAAAAKGRITAGHALARSRTARGSPS